MSWHYLPGPVDHCLPAPCTGGEPSQPLRSKTIHGEFYCNGRLTDAYLDSLSGMTSKHSTADHGAEKSTSSQVGSHAPTSAQPEKAQASKAKQAASGPKWRELSMKYDRDTSTLRTHHSLFNEVLPLSSVTLPKWGRMTLDGELWEPITLPRLISGDGSGSWPTPRANKVTDENEDSWRKRNDRGDVSTPPLTLAVKLWPTPRTSGLCGGSGSKEMMQNKIMRGEIDTAEGEKIMGVYMWPTPNSRDWKGPPGKGCRERGGHQSSLPAEVSNSKTYPTPTSNPGRNETSSRKPDSKHHTGTTLHDVAYKSGGQLSPAWVEWLMNWPIGWTDLAPLSRDDFKRWRDLTLDGEWFQGDPADVIRSDISEGAKIVPRVSSGVKDRAKRLKAIGNGQVPICAAVAFEMLTE